MVETKVLTAEEKIHFYVIALRLFDSGKSHPQIIEILCEYINDDTANVITDKAFKEVWDKLHQKAANRLAKGKLWDEVVDELSVGEPYKDVIEWLVNDIYLRDFEVSHAEDKFHKRFGIWGYLLLMGIIQLIRYLISPYNKTYFLICMGIGFVGLGWGIWDFFINKKDDIVFRKFAEYERFKKMIDNKSRVDILFTEKENRILNVYCTAGYPQLNSTLEVMKALQQNGADIIELGIPYSDPLADGPVIQHSSSIAIANGMTIAKLFEQIKDFRRSPSLGGVGEVLPVILMGYMNPVLQYGFEKFCADAAAVGIDGLILPDLPEYEFETEYGAIIKKYNLDFIFLVTPETSEERIKKLDSLSSGFLYAVSSSSTTGSEKKSNNENYLLKLKRMNLINPVLVGFGINNKQSFDAVCQLADGGIIGSAYIKSLENSENVNAATKSFLSSILG